MTIYHLSPSDLTFSWDGCKRCFYLKVKHNIVYRGPFPGMFGKMGDLTSNYYLDKPSSEISPDLPAGMVKFREKWVKSVPIGFPDTSSQCVIRGRFDAILAFEDGSYGIIDYKTSDASEEKAAFYSRQLSAYAYALENPAPGALSLAPITRLGLFIITPNRFERMPNGETAFVTKTTWMDIPRDNATFLVLLKEVVSLLDQPTPPVPAEDCGLCNYRKDYHEAGILE
jgi:PD-(D/E)XK nuclease superfamily